MFIDEEKHNQLNVVHWLKGLNETLPEKYLRVNSIYYEYISFISHVVPFYQAKNYTTWQFFIKRAFEFSLKTETKSDIKVYLNRSQKYMIRISSYLQECELLEENLIGRFEVLGILERKNWIDR